MEAYMTIVMLVATATIFGLAVLAEELQERALRRRLRPADPVKVAAFRASRRVGA